MFRHVLICLCAFASVQFTLQEWAIDDTGCITPDNDVGDCIDIYACKPIIGVLKSHQKRNKVIPERLKSVLAKHICGVGKVTKVCCPRVYKTPKPPPKASTPGITKLPPTRKPITIPTTPPTVKITSSTTPEPKKVCCPRVHKKPKTPSKPTTPGISKLSPTPKPITIPTTPPTIKITLPTTPEPNISGRRLLPQDSCGSFESEDKVALGQRAQLFEFPWMALLAYRTNSGIKYLCGGSLINDRYVLTAAHCIRPPGGETLSYVRLGEYDINNTTDCDTPPNGDTFCQGPIEDITVEETVVHPAYNFTTYHNDIGLIRLQRSVKIKGHISPICLPMTVELRSAAVNNVVLTGWGLTENNITSDVLQKAEVSIMDQTECRRIYKRSFVSISESQICTGGLTGVGSCHGDSGGPIQLLQVSNFNVRYVQYGIISLGPQICGTGLPGIHINVVNYMDWIISNIKP